MQPKTRKIYRTSNNFTHSLQPIVNPNQDLQKTQQQQIPAKERRTHRQKRVEGEAVAKTTSRTAQAANPTTNPFKDPNRSRPEVSLFYFLITKFNNLFFYCVLYQKKRNKKMEKKEREETRTFERGRSMKEKDLKMKGTERTWVFIPILIRCARVYGLP